MRRVIAILCVCLLLTGCGTRYAEREDDSDFGDGYFTLIRSWGGSFDNDWCIVYANDTKVKYLIRWTGYQYAITALYNADGTLQIYEEE